MSPVGEIVGHASDSGLIQFLIYTASGLAVIAIPGTSAYMVRVVRKRSKAFDKLIEDVTDMKEVLLGPKPTTFNQKPPLGLIAKVDFLYNDSKKNGGDSTRDRIDHIAAEQTRVADALSAKEQSP